MVLTGAVSDKLQKVKQIIFKSSFTLYFLFSNMKRYKESLMNSFKIVFERQNTRNFNYEVAMPAQCLPY